MGYIWFGGLLFLLIILVVGTACSMSPEKVRAIHINQFLNEEWVGNPSFGASYAAVVLFLAGIVFCGADWTLSGALASNWSKQWPTVGPFLTIISAVLVLLSWLSPGLFWVRMQPWAEALSDDRESIQNWHENGRPASPLKLDKTQSELLRRHRACAMSWLAFWVLIPPVWFWFEYAYATSAMDKDIIDLTMFKDLQDRAKSIWIAWALALAAWHGVRGTPLSK